MSDVKYSTMEKDIIRVLQEAEGKHVSTIQIVDEVYPKDSRPLTARQSVISVINSLIKKVEMRKETFTIKKTARSGPSPMEFWIEGKNR